MSNAGLSREQHLKHAEECCKLANDRFNLQYALRLLLNAIGANPATAIAHVRNGEMEEFQKIIDAHTENLRSPSCK